MIDHHSLHCRQHDRPLGIVDDGSTLSCDRGCRYPVRDGVPRISQTDGYSKAFGLQWNAFRRTQLDSVTGTSISRDRLSRMLGGSLDAVDGALVLEVGCGAGRFSEVLLDAGARVVAVDLSSAVDANLANNGGNRHLAILQADVMSLPFAPAQFDVVLAIGMVQHTPDPERTIAELCSHVRPGGLLALDHYAPGYPSNRSRRLLRRVLTRLSPAAALTLVRGLVSAVWPLHRALYLASSQIRGPGRLYNVLARSSPVVDYHRTYPQLSPSMLRAWAMLDTHDTLTDRYKHLRSADSIAATLAACGMEQIETAYAGNGVEARARRPRARDGR